MTKRNEIYRESFRNIGTRENAAGGVWEKLKGPNYLPAIEEIKNAFYNLRDKGHFLGKAFEDENEPVYEVLNKEFISALGSYLAERAEDLGASEEKPARILEVAAGSGRLTHFLKEHFKKKDFAKINLVATDISPKKSHFPIEKLSYIKALKKYKPDMVICAWMPNKDWTADFRSQENLEEYILIGETDFGRCGEPWLTWGVHYPDDENFFKGKKPPYEKDNFEKIPLKNISKKEICRYDYLGENGEFVQHSETVSFRRKLR